MNPITWWRHWWGMLTMWERIMAVIIGIASLIVIVSAFASTSWSAEDIVKQPSIDPTIMLAAIGVVSLIVSSILAPILVSRYQTKALLATKAADREEDRRDREADRLRQQRDRDAQVARDAETARVLARNTEKAVAATENLTKNVDKVSRTADIIHTLTNSKLTDVSRQLRDVSKELLVEKKKNRHPSIDDLAAIKALEQKIADLDDLLADRATQNAKVEEQQAQEPRV